jgi:hypothetical protein
MSNVKKKIKLLINESAKITEDRNEDEVSVLGLNIKAGSRKKTKEEEQIDELRRKVDTLRRAARAAAEGANTASANRNVKDAKNLTELSNRLNT